MRPAQAPHNSSRRNTARVLTLGAVAAVVLLASTLEIDLFKERLTLRLAVLLAGLLPAAWVLYRVFSGQVTDGRYRRAVILAILVVHIIATLYFFPLDGLLNDRPAINLDHSLHYYQAYQTRDVVRTTLQIDRYDPYFMAGYPGGTIFDLDMKGAEVFCAFMPILNVARSLKIFILFGYLIMIATMYWGSRLHGFKFEESILGLLVFLAYWHWGRPYAGDFRFAGMFSFVFATHLCFLLVALLRKVPQHLWLRTFFILGPFAFLIHPTAVVMLPVPFLVAIAIDHRQWRLGTFLLLLVWCLGVIFVNYLWLEPFFKYIRIKTTTEMYFQIKGWRGLIALVGRPSCLLAIAMIVLSVVGVWQLAKERRLSSGLPALMGSVFLFFVAGAGVYLWGLNQLEPGRFLFGGFLFLTPLAGVGTRCLRDGFLRWTRGERARDFLKTSVTVILVLFMLPLSLLESKSYYRHTMRTSYPPGITSLIENIDRHVDKSGRLMIEDSAAMYYGDIHLPALLPLVTGVEQIGGPFPNTYLLYYFTTFSWERTFGKPLEQWDAATLQPYLELYNVRWILTARRESGRFMAELLDKEPTWQQRRYKLWAVGPERERTDGEQPIITADINRITIENANVSEGYLLSYHWVPGLSTDPPAEISARNRLDDPVPFIFLEPNGASRVVIKY